MIRETYDHPFPDLPCRPSYHAIAEFTEGYDNRLKSPILGNMAFLNA